MTYLYQYYFLTTVGYVVNYIDGVYSTPEKITNEKEYEEATYQIANGRDFYREEVVFIALNLLHKEES